MPLATLLNCSSLVIPSRVFHMPIGSDNSRMSRRATSQSVTSPSAGRRPCQPTFVVLPFAQPTAFTAGCGLARRSVSSHGTTGSVFWRQATFVPHARSGSAVTVIRCSPREPTFGTGATMACGGLKKNQCEYDGGWGIPRPNFGRSGAVQAPSFPGALHDLRGGRTRFLVPSGSRSQRVLSGGSNVR